MPKALTVAAIKNATPKAKPYRLFDHAGDGLLVQIYPSGKRTFFVAYTADQDGKKVRRFYRLGQFSSEARTGVTLKQARQDAKNIRTRYIDRGLDPKVEDDKFLQEQKEAKKKADAIGTVDQLFTGYLSKLRTARKKSEPEFRRMYEKDIRDQLGKDTKAKDVTPEDIADALSLIYPRGEAATDRTRALMSAAFNFGMAAGLSPKDKAMSRRKARDKAAVTFAIASNPVVDVERVQDRSTIARDRNLSKDEIRRFWKMLVTSGMTLSSQSILKLQLCLGSRMQEISGMRWEELDLDAATWTLPGERSKNGKENVLPLPEIAIRIFRRLEKFKTNETFVFPGRDDPEKPIGWKSVGRALARAIEDAEMEPFQARDLRRTFKTRMIDDLDIDKQVTDVLQNHAAKADVSATHYVKATFWKKKTAAMERWNDHLWSILTRREHQNVVKIGSAATPEKN